MIFSSEAFSTVRHFFYIRVDLKGPKQKGDFSLEMVIYCGCQSTVVLCGDPALFELGAPLRTFYERS